MRTIIIVTSSAAALFSLPAFAQQHDSTSVPDFSGLWTHPSFPGFEPPASGPGPVVNKSRFPDGPNKGAGDFRHFVGDYANPILKPQAASVVKQHGEISLRGVTYPTPSNQCWPEPPPYIFWNPGMQMLQQPHQITILYDQGYQVRHVRMNEPHPARVIPSWYGDSVAHYESDTLVIDTVGIRSARPFAMVDMYGTPYTDALHVVERYRLLDYEAAKEGLERDAKENANIGRPGTDSDAPLRIDPDYRGKHLQLEFTVEDEGVFTTPWSATMTYRPGFNWRGVAEWQEVICAENVLFSAGKDEAVPHVDRSDF
jgi:hypothetical protein